MKILLFLLAMTLVGLNTSLKAQSLYHNKPLLHASSAEVDIKIGKEWIGKVWTVLPEIKSDSLNIFLFSKNKTVRFKTDQQTLRMRFKSEQPKSFYVRLNGNLPAHTVITGDTYNWQINRYDNSDPINPFKLFFESANHKYFESLRKAYPLDHLLKADMNDTEKVLAILNWTHHQWKHNGSVSPKGKTGIEILDEAKAGGRFPCFAYSIVLKDQLTAYGFPARVLYLKTKDATTRTSSPGHVVTEVFIKDLGKWAYIDGQFNVMPTYRGRPLNAAEFQQALVKNYNKVRLRSMDQVSKYQYVGFVHDYLYYFDTKADNRILPESMLNKVAGKPSIMLVPLKGENLTKIAYWQSSVDYCYYTNTLKEFYSVPN
jgi:hypothetical protein